jgi:hypothetical protein
MGELERVTAPHSSKVSVDKMLPEERPREEITNCFICQPTGESLKIHREERNCGGEIPKLSHELNAHAKMILLSVLS